jgi:transposase-like protein
VRLVIDGELPVTQAARDLGMPVNTLHRWVKKAGAGMCQDSCRV